MSWKTHFAESEQYNYEYFQAKNVCRICWCPNASREITKDSEDTLKISLYDKIIYCLDIDIAQCTSVNKLCCDCITEILRFYDFKTFCHDTDARLKQIIQNGNKSNNIEVKNENIGIFNLQLAPDNEYNFIDDTDIAPEVTIKRVTIKNSIRNSPVKLHPHEDEAGVRTICEDFSNTTQPKPVLEKLKVKKNKHSSGVTFCGACHLDCGSKEKYSEHNAQYHGIEESGTVFKCFSCDKRFKSKKSRASHEINFCKGLKDGYKCRVCERFLPKRNLYDKHMRYHLHNRRVDVPDDVFKCKKCFSRFETKESLTQHMSTHELKKNFVCETCGRVFSRQDYLYKHTLTHAGVKRHSCPHCDFKATQRSSLTMHIRKHTGERPYGCDLCPLRCVSSSNLRAHRRRHLHIKKYECTICNKKFGYKMSLDEHISTTHERSELHSCEHCGASYSRIRGLRRHLAAKHGKKEKQDVTTDKTSEIVDDNVHNDQENVSIVKNVRYELKDDLLMIKNSDCEVFMV